MATYVAVNHVGKFRRGQLYTTEQLGVLGRMAVASGHLKPYVEADRPKKAAPQRRKKGLTNGEQGGV